MLFLVELDHVKTGPAPTREAVLAGLAGSRLSEQP